jgi:hypothetical protein
LGTARGALRALPLLCTDDRRALFGWATVSAAPLGVPTMWFGVFEWPDIPYLGDLPRAQKRIVEGPLLVTHAVLAFTMMGPCGAAYRGGVEAIISKTTTMC